MGRQKLSSLSSPPGYHKPFSFNQLGRREDVPFSFLLLLYSAMCSFAAGGNTCWGFEKQICQEAASAV